MGPVPGPHVQDQKALRVRPQTLACPHMSPEGVGPDCLDWRPPWVRFCRVTSLQSLPSVPLRREWSSSLGKGLTRSGT